MPGEKKTQNPGFLGCFRIQISNMIMYGPIQVYAERRHNEFSSPMKRTRRRRWSSWFKPCE